MAKKTDKSIRRVIPSTIVLIALAFLMISTISQKRSGKIVGVAINVAPVHTKGYLITKAEVLGLVRKNINIDSKNKVDAIGLSELESVLLKDPFIKDVKAFIDAEHILRIDVEQFKPVARLIDAKNRHYYMDTDGVVFPISKNFVARLPVITGYLPDLENSEPEQPFIKDLRHFVGSIYKDDFCFKLIEQININKKGEASIIPKLGKQVIYFGSLDLIDDKMKRLKSLYMQALPHEGWNTYKKIDLRYENQVVCQK